MALARLKHLLPAHPRSNRSRDTLAALASVCFLHPSSFILNPPHAASDLVARFLLLLQSKLLIS